MAFDISDFSQSAIEQIEKIRQDEEARKERELKQQRKALKRKATDNEESVIENRVSLAAFVILATSSLVNLALNPVLVSVPKNRK